jgi:hypothetical protein
MTIDLLRTIFSNRNQFDTFSRPVFLFASHFTGSAAPTKVIVYT